MSIELLRTLCLAASAGALVAAAIHDVRSYLIPNRFAAAIALSWAVAMPTMALPAILDGLAIGGVMLAAGIVCFAMRWLGGGDVKLLAAVGLWLTPALLSPFALVTSLAGAALGIVMLSPLHRLFPPAPAAQPAASGTMGALRQPMPFAVAIAVGGLFALYARLSA